MTQGGDVSHRGPVKEPLVRRRGERQATIASGAPRSWAAPFLVQGFALPRLSQTVQAQLRDTPGVVYVP